MKGIAKDICPKCKNCKGVTRESNGIHVWLTEVECEDPYDGMIKTLQADSDICCSMFEQKPPCEKCARFDGVYCHGPNGTITISYKAYFHEGCKCPLYEEKKETHETKTAHEIELEAKVTALLSEVDNLKETNENLTKMVERRDRWVDGLQNDVYTLQNEILTIRDIAQKVYDDTNRD